MSTPTPYNYSPSEQQFIQGVLQNPVPPVNPNSQYAMPQAINDVAGVRNSGFVDADTAARAAAQSLHPYTQQSGSEAGAWIVSKAVNGQDRFFVVAPSQGVQNTVDNQVALKDLNNFLQANPNDKYTTVAHIHSHPQTITNSQGQTGLIQEGPSRGDFNSWGGNNIHGLSQNKGYMVSGDGDVYRLDFPNLAQLPPQQLSNLANGQFTSATVPTLSRIGDVDLKIDTPLTPNLWATAKNGQPVTMLPQSQVVDAVKLLSDPGHPDNKMYGEALQGIAKLDPSKTSFANEQDKQNAAAALVYEAKRSGMGQIDHVTASKDGQTLFAVQGALSDPAQIITRPGLDKTQAAAQSVEDSSLKLLNDSPNFVKPAQTTSQTPTQENPTQTASGYSR
jgi:hypothetical protein